MDIKEILVDAGYTVVEGSEAVKDMIKKVSDSSATPRCSGYGVFPGGKKCEGCGDCEVK